MEEAQRQIDPATGAQQRLHELLRSNRIVRFHENIPDKEYPFVTCSIYGSPKTNELFVKLSNGEVTFVESTPSRLLSPPMDDRIFGMDVLDEADAFQLADRMWETRRARLVQREWRAS